MDSEQDVAYRLRLAEGFLQEAEQDLPLSRWRSCVDNARLAVENAVKAVVARYGPVPRTHDITRLLDRVLSAAVMNSAVQENLSLLKHLAEQLGYAEHIRSDYGEATCKTPWELFDQADAQQAVSVARQAVVLAREIVGG